MARKIPSVAGWPGISEEVTGSVERSLMVAVQWRHGSLLVAALNRDRQGASSVGTYWIASE